MSMNGCSTNWKEKDYLKGFAVEVKKAAPSLLGNFFDVLFIEDLKYLAWKLDLVHRLTPRIEGSCCSVRKRSQIDSIIYHSLQSSILSVDDNIAFSEYKK